MKTFPGFPTDESLVTLPASFFTGLLPLIDDLAELKVTLACWRLLAAQADPAEGVPASKVLHDAALADLDAAAIEAGLERAVARGTLLRLSRGAAAAYFANTAAGRAAITAAHKAEWAIAPAAPRTAPPNIFTLYEQTIGLLSPLLADELRDAEESFPPEWIAEAFRQAARQNVRSWAYVHKILQRRAQGSKRQTQVSSEWDQFIRGKT